MGNLIWNWVVHITLPQSPQIPSTNSRAQPAKGRYLTGVLRLKNKIKRPLPVRWGVVISQGVLRRGQIKLRGALGRKRPTE